MLEIKEITKHYMIGEKKQEVLKKININFRKKEFVSVLGASGSGKTTLLNIIGGLDKYDSGDLKIDGISTKKYTSNDWDSYRNNKIGFIFQSYNLINHQTILSNVELSLTLSGMPKKERRKRAIEALEKVGLKEHLTKRPNQLSGGQMQRVAIARALVNDPDIILADEPTGALDSKTSIQIMDILKEISKNKLVIMVTHNPELAKEYSTRIIELKDGIILKDSDPFEKEESVEKSEKKSKTSMSLFTSIELSFKNLLTKKGRTILTAIAGSIGIIGIAMIISLSNGVQKYAKNIENDNKSNYSLKLEKTTNDAFSLTDLSKENKKIPNGDNLISYDDVTTQIKSSEQNTSKKNNLKEFKSYIEQNKELEDLTKDIAFGYNLDLQVYSNNNCQKIEKIDFSTVGSNSSDLLSQNSDFTNNSSNMFQQISDKSEFIKENYDLVAGSLPKEYNEIVLIVNKDGTLPDSLLYSLNIKDRNELKDLVSKVNNKEEIKIDNKEYSYDDFLNLTYKLILNTDYYKSQNGVLTDYSNDKNYMNNVIANGTDLKIVGVLKTKNESDIANILGYSSSLEKYLINEIDKTDIAKMQINNNKVNIFTGDEFDGINTSYEKNAAILGIASLDNPDSIEIYPKDSNAKEQILNLIKKYNDDNTAKNRADLAITYTDSLKEFVKGITGTINVVSYVLIALVAISLIVSSIMISIITYISVLERTKEIGILRAIGASKKDVSRVFKSETLIEGFISGFLGVAVTLLLNIPINLIVAKMAKIEGISTLPIGSAVILILLSMVLTLIAGLIPSGMASKKDPVEALRSE